LARFLSRLFLAKAKIPIKVPKITAKIFPKMDTFKELRRPTQSAIPYVSEELKSKTLSEISKPDS
jgi:hypothetical protein